MIRTESALAARLNVPRETLAIASQTVPGGVKAFLRAFICDEHGEMTVLGMGEKGVQRAGEAWELVYNEPLRPKKARARK